MNTNAKMRFSLTKQPLFVSCFRFILVILAVSSLYPILFAFQTSFKTMKEFYASIWSWPQHIGIENYAEAMVVGKVGEYFGNSIIIAVCSIVLIQIISILAAYSIARLKLPKPELILLVCFGLQLLPTETIIIPLYIIMSKIGILETMFVPIIIAYVGWSIPGTTIILKNYFDTTPVELLEAARIDGAGEVTTMFKIVLPLMKGAIATCAVMNFTFVWGELMWARTATLVTTKGIPLTVGLLNFKGQYGTNWPLLCAAVCVIVLPLYLVFLFLQKYFVAGLTAGSVKG